MTKTMTTAVSTSATVHEDRTTATGTEDTTTGAAHPTIAVTPSAAAAPAYVQQCAALLAQLTLVVPPGDALTAMDKKRKAKARKGSEQYIPQLVALAKQFGVNLMLVPTDAIELSSAEAQALVPLIKQMGVLNKQLNDRVFSTRADSWSGASKLYAILRRLAKDNGDLAAGLVPVEAFFNHRHPLVAKNHPKTKKGKAALKAAKAESASQPAVPEAPSPTAETRGIAPLPVTPSAAVPKA